MSAVWAKAAHAAIELAKIAPPKARPPKRNIPNSVIGGFCRHAQLDAGHAGRQNGDGGIGAADEMAMTKDLEVRHCRALLAVKDKGGVGAAARALGVAQSTISETLLSLERLVGAAVVTRRIGYGATLTAAAEALVPHARILVTASESALAAIAKQGQGAIRLGAVESISSFLLPAPLKAFRARWPEIDVRIAIGLCEDLRARVGRCELDAALTIEGSGARDVSQPPQTQLRFVVAPNHALVRAATVTRADIEGRTLLLADHAGAFNALLTAWFGGEAVKLESAGSIDGVKRGVLTGDVIGVLPAYAVSDEVGAGLLVELALRDPPPPVALRLTTLGAPPAGSPLESLLSHIAATFPAPSMAIN